MHTGKNVCPWGCAAHRRRREGGKKQPRAFGNEEKIEFQDLPFICCAAWLLSANIYQSRTQVNLVRPQSAFVQWSLKREEEEEERRSRPQQESAEYSPSSCVLIDWLICRLTFCANGEMEARRRAASLPPSIQPFSNCTYKTIFWFPALRSTAIHLLPGRFSDCVRSSRYRIN